MFVIETKKDLKALLNEAEYRASKHFSKLQSIESIIRQSDANKELYAETIQKIKNELAICDHY